MGKWLVLVFSLSAAVVQANDDCGEDVDMADSLNFHKMHIECDNDPVTLYDPESSSILPGLKKAQDVYTPVVEEETIGSTVVAPVVQNQPQASENAGKVFNIRQPFTLIGGTQAATNGLFAQMIQICPKGFEKNKEWVVPAKNGYFLHYQFTCAE